MSLLSSDVFDARDDVVRVLKMENIHELLERIPNLRVNTLCHCHLRLLLQFNLEKVDKRTDGRSLK